ncbi:MAG: hypothetical protein ACKOYK_04250 [Cyanobium sp.]|jgi:hypothetical protein
MAYSITTHDAWGQVPVGEYESLELARAVFVAMQQDPWYRQDGTVKGIELVEVNAQGERVRLEWFGF